MSWLARMPHISSSEHYLIWSAGDPGFYGAAREADFLSLA
jgi:hypothetical protein